MVNTTTSTKNLTEETKVPRLVQIGSNYRRGLYTHIVNTASKERDQLERKIQRQCHSRSRDSACSDRSRISRKPSDMYSVRVRISQQDCRDGKVLPRRDGLEGVTSDITLISDEAPEFREDTRTVRCNWAIARRIGAKPQTRDCLPLR